MVDKSGFLASRCLVHFILTRIQSRSKFITLTLRRPKPSHHEHRPLCITATTQGPKKSVPY